MWGQGEEGEGQGGGEGEGEGEGHKDFLAWANRSSMSMRECVNKFAVAAHAICPHTVCVCVLYASRECHGCRSYPSQRTFKHWYGVADVVSRFHHNASCASGSK